MSKHAINLASSGKATLRALMPVALAVSLAGCGYHLRGHSAGEAGTALMEPVYLRAPDILDDALIIALGEAGSSVVTNVDGARIHLDVLSQQFERRLLSVDPVTGREREFELLYIVRFTASRGGQELLPERQVKVLRDIVINTEAIVAKLREEELIQTEMRTAAADQIVRMLSLAASS